MSIDNFRPQFHFTAAREWINDPNGLVFFEGEYHLFYQTNPFGEQWGHMSWGHAVSRDLLNWEILPIAIAEDSRVSIFSGSVVVDTHNTSGLGDGVSPPLIAIYTGCLRRNEGGQAQEIASSRDRGRTWVKYAGNPVLDLGLRDFRDPKVFWHEETARWVMLVALPHDGKLVFYASADLKSWHHLSDFHAGKTGEGILECPDIFMLPLENEAPIWVLKIDVLEGHPSKGSGARVFFGHFDGTQFTETRADAWVWADYGADFYAAISWANLPIADAVWIGWMNCHRYAKHTPTSPWRGAMGIARTLRVRRHGEKFQLLQAPVAAVETLREQVFVTPAWSLDDDECNLIPSGTDARTLDLTLTCTHTTARECGVMVRVGEGCETRVGYDAMRGVVFVDRSRAGFSPEDPHYKARREAPCPAPSRVAPLRLRVLVDVCSLEVFVGDGEVVLTEQIFPDAGSNGVKLYARGGVSDFGESAVWVLRDANRTMD